jgi:CelD/BcsL family acetyltransferase involved in cellulose biosynthesis
MRLSTPGFSLHPLDDLEVAAAWDALAEETGAPPFFRHGWFSSWSRAYGVPIEVAAYGSGALEAVAPVIRTRSGVMSPVNQESPGFGFVASTEAARSALLSGLLGGRALFRRLGAEDAAAVLSAAGPRPCERTLMQRSPFIAITSDWGAYEASLRSKFRKDLKRRWRRFAEHGEVEIAHELGLSQGSLDEMFRIEELQWKGREGTAMGSRPETKMFYEEIARWASENGWLRLWWMRADGSACAFALDVVVGQTYYGLKVGYDPNYARFSPGMLLQDDTIRYAFDQGLKGFEFLGADEPYKLNWTDSCHELFAVRVYESGVRGAIAHGIGRTLRAARDLARANKEKRGPRESASPS